MSALMDRLKEEAKRLIEAGESLPFPSCPARPHSHRARITRIRDGDTIECLLDTSFRGRAEWAIRLLGVDCPKGNTKAGERSKKFLSEWIAAAANNETAWPFWVETVDQMDRDRWLGHVWRNDTSESAASALLAAGHGEAVAFK